jgi:hypothetical protein
MVASFGSAACYRMSEGHIRIEIERHPDVGVSESFLNDLGLDPGVEEPRGARLPCVT